MSNKFLDQTLTLHEYCINKLQGSKSELYITLIILLSPDYEYPQHKTRFLFSEQVKCWREAKRELRNGQLLWVCLPKYW